MRRDVSTAARAPSTRLSRGSKALRNGHLAPGRSGAAPAGRRPRAKRQRASAATPKKNFTSRSELAGLSEACTELNCLLSP
jgi:hypothetical protein